MTETIRLRGAHLTTMYIYAANKWVGANGSKRSFEKLNLYYKILCAAICEQELGETSLLVDIVKGEDDLGKCNGERPPSRSDDYMTARKFNLRTGLYYTASKIIEAIESKVTRDRSLPLWQR